METIRICPNCQNPLPPEAPQGLCPQCLIRAGLKTATAGVSPLFEPPPVEEVARLFPQLEIIGFIGRGGMGAVYKARQKSLDRIVALKLLPPGLAQGAGFAERFNREARALARLSHPNIVMVHDFGQAGEWRYLLMEYVDGSNLRDLEGVKNLTPQQALAIVPQICDALQFAHGEGVVHRDIKPENILVDKKGRVKIADFGIAKMLGLASEPGALTGAKDVIGTPQYMAPEQIEKPTQVDHRADIYSLGVVFYEMLTGELPIGRFQPPSQKVQVDVRLDEVVLQALEKEPSRRYQQASEVKTRVESIASSPARVAAAAGAPWASDAPPWFRRGFGAVVTLAILIPSCLGGLALLMYGGYGLLRRGGSGASPQLLTQEGFQLWQQKKWSDAAEKFRAALRAEPTNAAAWNGLGWSEYNAGDASAGEKDFEKAVALDDKQAGAWNGLGQIYLTQGRTAEAEKDLLKAAPAAPAAWWGLARLYLLEGKYDEAQKWAQEIVDASGADPEAAALLKAAREKRTPEYLRVTASAPTEKRP